MILVIGGGIAGLSAAHAAHAAGGAVRLVCAGSLSRGETTSTALAQGGVAAAIGERDAVADHLADTIAAGAGLTDAEAASVLVAEGADAMRRLIARGFDPDRDPSGAVALGLEAAHGAARIVHAGGDRTGRRLLEHLVDTLPAGVRVIEHAEVTGLLCRGEAVVGAELSTDRAFGAAGAGVSGVGAGAEVDGAAGVAASREQILADAVVLATGGYAALFARTSNAASARGGGIMLAAEVGALVADLEFVQFHPTVLAGTGSLISEAVRGAGATLVDDTGERYMVSAHEFAELAPRDVVSRISYRRMRDTGAAHVWLDARAIEAQRGAGSLARMFPGIDQTLRANGIDWTRELVPVAPAAHYSMGGVACDLDGRTSVPGLFVAGEVASTGVHGANRLASNSLLEGLVFAERAARAALGFADSGEWKFSGDAMPALISGAKCATGAASQGSPMIDAVLDPAALRTELAALVDAGLGIERDAAGIAAALRGAERIAALAEAAAAGPRSGDPEHRSDEIAWTKLAREARLVTLLAEAAAGRTESRGAHQRADYPATATHATRQAWWLVAPHEDQAEAAATPRSMASC